VTPDRWTRIEQLFHSALEQSASRRAEFLDAQCAGDAALRAGVRELLESHSPGDSIDDLASTLAADWLAQRAGSLVGSVIGNYRLLDWIGSGGMGNVYRALDLSLGRTVALKVLPPYLAADDRRVRQFLAEAQAAAILNHPNIATVYGLEQSPTNVFLAMEYVDGETLSQRIARGPIQPAEVIRVGLQVADALVEAHARGILHRDVKPANLMVTARGVVKLLDFGLARPSRTPPPGSATGTPAGTLDYMSPEQLLGWDPDERVDVFGLGVVLYEALSGRRPFEAPDRAETVARILEGRHPPLRELRQAIPRSLAAIVERCLERDRERRFQSVAQLRESLAAVDAVPSRQPNWVCLTLVAATSLGAGWLLGRGLRGDRPSIAGAPRGAASPPTATDP